MTDEIAKPKSIQLHMTGPRGPIALNGIVELLNNDGKIERTNVLAAGRLMGENSFYDLFADDIFVARLSVQADEWLVQYPDGSDKQTEHFTRSGTMRPHRTGSRGPRVRDNGPDLLLAVSRVIAYKFADLKSTTPKRAKVSQKKELEDARAALEKLVSMLAEVTGKTNEEVLKSLGVE
jgi:hypothetical protein